jgi:dipeptidyl aminopeptidase/acylaminoacyl peptidase
VGAHAASLDERVEALFRPPLGERITLSPEGQRVAYTMHTGGDLAIVMVSLDGSAPKRTVVVDPGREAISADERARMQLRFLRWAPGGRLVYAPVERVVPLPPVTDKSGRTTPNPDGPVIVAPVMVVDADGKQRGTLVDARDFQETPEEARRTLADLLRTTKQLAVAHNEPVHWRMPHLEILGFSPRERDHLVIETRGAYSMPAQHIVDTRSGDVRMFGGDWPSPPGEPHVFDWFRLKIVGERKEAARPLTAWRDDELAQVQRELETKFPRRTVEILDWSETRSRVLFRVTGGTDAGRIFVYQRPEDLPLEILQRAPWLGAAKLHETRFFEFDAPGGARLSGYLTWPKNARLPPPLIIAFPSGFPGRAQPAFDPEAQVFADWGFAVARLNHRSVAGVKSQDLNALRAAIDRVAVDDALATMQWLAARNPDRAFDPRRVVALGRGFGGYLAARALQLQPAEFRCGIVIDAPMDLRRWLRLPETKAAPDIPAALIDHEGVDWKKFSVLEQVETLDHPMLFLVDPARSRAIAESTEELRTRLAALGRAPELAELDAGFAAGHPRSRAAAYRKIEDFLNGRLQGYAVKIGPATEVR